MAGKKSPIYCPYIAVGSIPLWNSEDCAMRKLCQPTIDRPANP